MKELEILEEDLSNLRDQAKSKKHNIIIRNQQLTDLTES